MRILDENDIEITDPNFELGYLREEKIICEHHDAIEPVEEIGHYEVIAEYPNGGKDVEWVVEIPGIEAEDAWDEYENIQRYILYTSEELVAIDAEKQKAIEEQELQNRIRKIAYDIPTWDELAAAIKEGVNSI